MGEKLSWKIVYSGLILGIITFVFGFGVLYMMWLNMDIDKALPGFSDYLAATIGDGICLPLLIFSLYCFATSNAEFCAGSNHKHIIISLIGGLIGLIIQISWLMNDSITLNWSIPQVHHFNVAGWWHALFFVYIFVVISFFLSKTIIIGRKKDALVWEEEILLSLVSFSGSLFLLCHFFDDYPKIIENCIGVFFISIGMLYGMLLLFGRLRENNYQSAISMGIICSLGVFYGIIGISGGKMFYAIAGTCSIIFLSRIGKNKLITFLITEFMFCFSAFNIFYFLSSNEPIKFKILIAVICCWLIIVYDHGLLKKDNDSLVVAIVVFWVLVSSTYSEITIGNNVISFVFVTIIYGLFSREIRSFFNDVVYAEEQKNSRNLGDKEFFETKAIAYIKIFSCVICITIMFVLLLFRLGRLNNNVLEIGNVRIDYYVGLVICAGAALINLFLAYLMKNSKKIVFALVTVFSLYLYIMYSEIIDIVINLPCNFDAIGSVIWVFSIFANLGAAMLISHGFYMNSRKLRGLECEKYIKKFCLIMGVFVFLISYSASFKIAFMPTWNGILSSTINIIVAVVMLPALAGVLFWKKYKESPVIPNKPLGGMLQDGGMVLLIMLFASFLPNMYCGVVKFNMGNNNNGIETLFGALALVITAFFPVTFCLQNNRQHLIRQYKVAHNNPTEMKRWEILRECIIKQSKQTCFSLLPYIVVIVISNYVKDFCNKEIETGDIKEYLRFLWNSNIETDDYSQELEKEGN